MPGCPTNAAYRETLPLNCPPPGAVPTHSIKAWRAVANSPVQDVDFHSVAYLNPGREAKASDVGKCSLRSVSLFTIREEAAKVQKLKGKEHLIYVALINLAPTLGCMEQSSSHVHWWPLGSCVPVSLVSKIEII